MVRGEGGGAQNTCVLDSITDFGHSFLNLIMIHKHSCSFCKQVPETLYRTFIYNLYAHANVLEIPFCEPFWVVSTIPKRSHFRILTYEQLC